MYQESGVVNRQNSRIWRALFPQSLDRSTESEYVVRNFSRQIFGPLFFSLIRQDNFLDMLIQCALVQVRDKLQVIFQLDVAPPHQACIGNYAFALELRFFFNI